MKIYSRKELDKKFKEEPQALLWTAIIPAAGKGTRLKYSKPKILYPILGRTILDRMIDLLDPFCSRFIFVLSPNGVKEISPLLIKRLSGRFEIAVQTELRGMADAIFQAVPHIATPQTLIIWGDQVAISPQTIEAIQKMHQSIPNAKLTLPIVKRKSPYVHYVIDKNGSFRYVLERREGALMPPVGEGDCGVFACNARRLREIYRLETKKGITLSQITQEWNFLPMLPRFEEGNDSVNAYQLETFEESVGVNDNNDVALLEKYFKCLQKT